MLCLLYVRVGVGPKDAEVDREGRLCGGREQGAWAWGCQMGTLGVVGIALVRVVVYVLFVDICAGDRGGPCELSSIFFECRTGVGERVCGIRVGGGGEGGV